MSKKFFLIITIILTSYVILGCSDEKKAAVKPQPEAPISIEERALGIVSKMSPAEKVGQMMFIGIHGTEINDDILYMLSEYHVGGIILFDRNMENSAQVSRLNKELQSRAREFGAGVPLFIAVDEEGGLVARMRHALPPPPSAESIGSGGDPKEARGWAEDTAKKLTGIGFNVNFAPVADVGSDNERSFADDPNKVSEFVCASADGYENGGILYCLKHFPGLGRTSTDTHIDSDKTDASADELFASDIVPFKKMIDSRPNSKFFIMVSHMTYSGIDPEKPASLSRAVMTDMLRKKLLFDGVVITDDLEMGAITNHYDFTDAGAESVKAGADMLLVCHEYSHEADVYNGILNALNKGSLSEERINDSVMRIVKMKLLGTMRQ